MARGSKPGKRAAVKEKAAVKKKRATRTAAATGRKGRKKAVKKAETYRHPEAESLLRPDIGTQAQFRKKKKAVTYRYDSSLSPSLEWDENPAREEGEALIREIMEAGDVGTAKAAASKLKAMSKPFLNWAGKAERHQFDVPTLPLFVHERLSTQAIIETLKGHRRDKEQPKQMDLFGDPGHDITDQVLKAYEHKDKWVNRMILGDSLVVMNSLLEYEGMGGQVQMIYIDPPYGVKFGSNFQPFVRTRDVKDGDDDHITREPEMVQAYRDTWELGIHSYLAYLRDRLLLCRELLTLSGSVFVQISDENIHHVRELLDEIFGPENSVSIIPFRKKTMPLGAKHLEGICDYLIWYAMDKNNMFYRRLYQPTKIEGDTHWNYVEFPDGKRRKMSKDEINNHKLLPKGAIPFQLMSLYPVGVNETGKFTVPFRGKDYKPKEGNSWFTNPEGMERLIKANRIEPYEEGETIRYVYKATDGLFSQITSLWSDTSAPRNKVYAVQTDKKVIERCILMTTAPGDLVLDPTCGGGTTPYVCEEWGRRWVTIDVSRVPLALARQRLLSRTYTWKKLKEDSRGPISGFFYQYKTNKNGEQIGGIVNMITRGTFSNNEPPEETILIDRPEENNNIVRVTGPFSFEATIPTPADWEEEPTSEEEIVEHDTFVDRMIEVLRKVPVLNLEGGRKVNLKNVRPPGKSLSLSAEAAVNGDTVAVVFGPENGAVSERLVFEAAKEANAKGYTHLYVIGFAIQPTARKLVESSDSAMGISATYVQATPDLLMGDLLKNMRSSQIFSVCGLPEIEVRKARGKKKKGEPDMFEVELLGMDVFDPATMELQSRKGDDVPAWFLDTDYNGLVFHVSQAFFPRTSAWDSLKKALKATHDETVWDHLAGTVSAPFEAGEHGQVAVKVIDDRGNELLVVKGIE